MEEDFYELIKQAFEKGLDEYDICTAFDNAVMRVKQLDDHCSECGALLSDEDYNTEYNRVPYGDTYADESIVVGYSCSKCGYEE